jgi:transposase
LADERVRRLMTIPGAGPVTALALVAVIGDIARFPSAGQLVGYLGQTSSAVEWSIAADTSIGFRPS